MTPPTRVLELEALAKIKQHELQELFDEYDKDTKQVKYEKRYDLSRDSESYVTIVNDHQK